MTEQQMLWLIPAFPLAAFLINGLLGRRFVRTGAHWISLLAVAASAALAGAVFIRAHGHPEWNHTFYTWISAGSFTVPLKLAADSLTAIMLVVVTSVSTLVHLYSIGYMKGDEGYHRFFAYLSLFTFSMLMLVLSANLLLLYVFWEAVGLCSYLLIGFWFHKKSAADAGKKAFLVNRVGDFGFAIGILLLIVHTKSVDYGEVFAAASSIDPGILTIICLLLFVGACGKSAQLPLHVWLPDAMEGPTPVSALIHAATMVTAGVYMVARCHPLYMHSETALAVVAVVGAATAVMAAAIAVTQTDLKRIMAYSTVSQLGYMFLGLGVGAYSAAVFHLFTHAFFKALLFLGAGSVMHAIGGDCDITRSGKLFGKIKVTGITFILGSLALAGIPPFAGFFSKEAILAAAYDGGHYWLFAAGMIAAGGTAFYVFRAVFSVFFSPREADALSSSGAHDDHGGHDSHGSHGGVHESPWVMLIPLCILAVLSVSAGWFGSGVTHFLDKTFYRLPHHEEGHHSIVLIISLAAAAGGILLAWATYQKGWIDPGKVAARWPLLYRLSKNKFYFDEIYGFMVIKAVLLFSKAAFVFDISVIDGIVNWWGKAAKGGGSSFSVLQSGRVRDYLLFMSLGMVVILGVWLWI